VLQATPFESTKGEVKICESKQVPEADLLALRVALSNYKVPKSNRPKVAGHSTTLGWSDTRRQKTVAQRSLQERAKRVQICMNEIVKKLFPGRRWSSLQVNYNTVSQEHCDSNNRGTSLIVTVGDYTGGSFVLGDQVQDTYGKLVEFDGKTPHSSEPFQGNRYSVIAFDHKSSHRIPESQRVLLEQLGYMLPDATDADAEEYYDAEEGYTDEAESDDDEDDENDENDGEPYINPNIGIKFAVFNFLGLACAIRRRASASGATLSHMNLVRSASSLLMFVDSSSATSTRRPGAERKASTSSRAFFTVLRASMLTQSARGRRGSTRRMKSSNSRIATTPCPVTQAAVRIRSCRSRERCLWNSLGWRSLLSWHQLR
jgi:hypothetical protein